MKVLLLIGILILVALPAVMLVLALYHHKKSASANIKLVGQPGEVEAPLAPEGTVFVGGELWRAKSKDGSHLASHARVRVVGFEGHLALVESYK